VVCLGVRLARHVAGLYMTVLFGACDDAEYVSRTGTR
jgi:hypothetical protein